MAKHYTYGASRNPNPNDFTWVENLPAPAQQRVRQLVLERDQARAHAAKALKHADDLGVVLSRVLENTKQQLAALDRQRRVNDIRATIATIDRAMTDQRTEAKPTAPTREEESSMSTPPVLDPAAGSRMMWFDKHDDRALFGDIRSEEHVLCDGRALSIHPDIVMDFRSMPFDDATFALVVFDPPHLRRAGAASWQGKKYGVLSDSWEDDIRAGFTECFRVLRDDGVLIFKWNETHIPLSQVLALTTHKPLFGHRSGKTAKTHWCTFIKTPEAAA